MLLGVGTVMCLTVITFLTGKNVVCYAGVLSSLLWLKSWVEVMHPLCTWLYAKLPGFRWPSKSTTDASYLS